MIYVVGRAPKSSLYQHITFEEFLKWALMLDEYELDIETTYTDFWCNKELVTVQIGHGGTQCVLFYPDLTESQKNQLKDLLEDARTLKLIHNALFEYVVLLFHGIMIENVFDTMLAEKILRGGIQIEGVLLYNLAQVAEDRLGIQLDKTEQTTFNLGSITESQVVYAAQDVQHLSRIRDQQVEELSKPDQDGRNLMKVAELEFEAVLGYGDITYNGMGMDSAAWLANLDLVEPLIEQADNNLEKTVYGDPLLYQRAVQLGNIHEEDQLLINWNSSNQKKQLLGWIFPHLEMVTKASILKFLKKNTFGDFFDNMLLEITNKDYTSVNGFLLKHYRERLIDEGFLIPAGTLTINWNSVHQVLPLLHAIAPKMKSMDKEAMSKVAHPIAILIKEYKDTLKLKTTYGESFLEKYLEPDGKIRTSFNQIVSTGRVSSSSPNMQNIPAKETVGNRYRNAFTADPGFVFVDSDYVSQELVIIAFLSKDPVWADALANGHDLHSVCAELVYKGKWKSAAQPDCAYYHKTNGKADKQKCNCKGHKSLRTNIKPINFGLAYGMSEIALAAQLGITVSEAKTLIEEYFQTFPKIRTTLNYLGNFGVKRGYIQTVFPFYRKRFFPDWLRIDESQIKAHIHGIQRNPTLGSIERASKNQPIQGSSADITKLSLVYIRRFINKNKLRDSIKLVAQVHDQNTTTCKKELASKWAPKLTELMEEAAKVIIPSGLLKAETNITDRWSK